jgi:two-component sensor histidine kinase
LPPGFDFAAQKGLGIKIIDVLAKQLDGGVATSSNNGRGTCLVVSFPRKSDIAAA